MPKASKPDLIDVKSSLRPSQHVSTNEIDKIWNAALEEMLLLYFPPFRAATDEELLAQTVVALKAYLEDLAGYPEAVLRAAWRATRRAHKVERWPTIQTICANLPATDNVAEIKGRGRPRLASDQEKSQLMEVYGSTSGTNLITPACAERLASVCAERDRAREAKAAQCDRTNREFAERRAAGLEPMATVRGFKTLASSLPVLDRE